MSAGQYMNKHNGSLTDPHNPTDCKLSDLSVNHHDACLPQHLNDEGPTSRCNASLTKNDIVNSRRGEGSRTLDKSESSHSASNKSFKNRTSFQAPGESKSSADGLSCGKKPQADGGTDVIPEVNHCAHESCSESSLLPTPVKLVSSMKGSREKRGISPKKLSVTWAPDVYDPIPTSVSHVPNNNQHRRRDGKKYRKNKKKGGAGKSDASRNNDKKQPKKKKKKNACTNNCKPMPDDSVAVGNSETQSSILDFDGAALKQSCGKSFLMTSVDKMHFPVAEAT